ncbi:cysteine desulfurase IscS [Luteitalea sp. TBR-22]|uniref:cysteine desulfurase family protein n=1 Tax=Luteitalea sp. TBR-22 TaxID=2802971 RepID=UPI001AF33D1A|nr:cysteine desulfurase family protein [Luteitalea sp. TBR-22]BCS31638.1 cysteine desulfurase IscS [Luteitalea sp. TBR-22]
MSRLYFDAHATTPCDPQVVAAMLPFFTERFGNAASLQHPYGWEAQEAVEQARQRVAGLVGAKLRDVVFTSGATEANNLAIRGVIEAQLDSGRAPADLHVVTLITEHPAVLDPCARLEHVGVSVTRVPVQPDGLVDPERLRTLVTPGTTLVSVMAGNNEIGVLQPLAAIAAIAHGAGAWFHCDASQATGYLAIDMAAQDIDLLSCTAHKIYGPKGVGALVVRRSSKVTLAAQHLGGGHERGLRSGTLNVPGIVGFGEAARLAVARRADDGARVGALRDRLWARLRASLPGVHLRGAATPRLPHNLNVGFDGVTGRDLILALTDVAVSPGAACASTSADASHVLLALGLDEAAAKSSLRFGLLRTVTEADVESLADRLIELVPSLRASRGPKR